MKDEGMILTELEGVVYNFAIQQFSAARLSPCQAKVVMDAVAGKMTERAFEAAQIIIHSMTDEFDKTKQKEE